MERLGLVGLPNGGKSSLFNALTGGDAVVAAHPFSTTETTVGRGPGPRPAPRPPRRDERAARRSCTPRCEFVDIAGLVAGASAGEGLGNRFLGRHPRGRRHPARAAGLRGRQRGRAAPTRSTTCDTLELELVLADLATVEAASTGRRQAAKGDKSLAGEVAALERAAGIARRRHAALPLRPHRRRARARCARLPAHQQAGAGGRQPRRGPAGDEPSIEPVPTELGDAGRGARRVACSSRPRPRSSSRRSAPSCSRGSVSARAPLPRVARAAYHLLGRRTFLTTGDKESRAWTFRAGAKAPECAGVIHSDLQRGFIRAEVIRWDELLELGSWTQGQGARQAARRGQGLRGRRRRRPRDPLQRVTAGHGLARPRRRGARGARGGRRRRRRDGAGCSVATARRRAPAPTGRRVHTIGMRFPIDVAFCDAEGMVVLARCTTGAVAARSPCGARAAFVIEAEAGAFERWRLRVGDRVELRA